MNKLTITVIGSAAVAALSLAASVIGTIRANRTIKKLRKAINRIDEVSDEKIADTMIESALRKSADRKVDAYAERAESDALNRIDDGINRGVRAAVNAQADLISSQVAPKIAAQVEALDIEALRRRVCDEATEHSMKKLDGVLDSSIKTFNDHLERTQKTVDDIYRAKVKKEIEGGNDNVIHLLFDY